jgi:hypothetical protein
VVIMSSTGTGMSLSTAMLTLIAATAPPGLYSVRVRIGAATVTVPMSVP